MTSEKNVDINRPMLKLGSSVGESLKVRWIGPHFFFSFELSYYKRPLRPRLGGAPEAGGQVPKKTLAVPVFIVQNDLGWH